MRNKSWGLFLGILFIAVGLGYPRLQALLDARGQQVPPPAADVKDLCREGFDFTGETIQVRCDGPTSVRFHVWGRLVSDKPLKIGTLGNDITSNLEIYGPGSQLTVSPGTFDIVPVQLALPSQSWGIGTFKADEDPRMDVVAVFPPNTPARKVFYWQRRGGSAQQYQFEESAAWQYLPLMDISNFVWE
jgi:hypothetical protein